MSQTQKVVNTTSQSQKRKSNDASSTTDSGSDFRCIDPDRDQETTQKVSFRKKKQGLDHFNSIEIKVSKFLLPDQENLPHIANTDLLMSQSKLNIVSIEGEPNVKKKPVTSKPTKILTDRFVPSRKASKLTFMSSNSDENINDVQNNDISSPQTALNLLYKQQILKQSLPVDDSQEQGQILFNNNNNFQFSNTLYYLDQLHPNNKLSPLISSSYFEVPDTITIYYSKYARKIPKVPFKVLDAPALQDDFYLNLIDWSTQNILSVALGPCVYLWNALSSKVTKLLDLGQADQVTSVAWSQQGPLMSVGTNSGEVQIWDTVKLKRIRSLKGHLSRVGTLCFSQSLLSSGSRDKQILQRDLRSPSQYLWKQSGHKQEVCGLKWSPDSQLLASGGNDNKLFIWSAHSTINPICKFTEHQAAVKAIAWSPHQHGLLASGGGTADRTIRFWNALEGKNLSKEDTGSQVCNLMFSKRENEIISTHGYSQNQIVIWKCNGMKRITTLTGHTYRVLYLAMSPDGQTIVTGAGDETLRFWNIYPQNANDQVTEETCNKLHPSNISIR